MDNRTAVIAVAGAFALGAVGTNAFADDDEGSERIDPVQVSKEDSRDDRRDERRDDRGQGAQGEPARDADDVDVEPRDDEDDTGGGDSNSAGVAGGGGDSDSAVVAQAPAPAPAPVYDDYASDYGDT